MHVSLTLTITKFSEITDNIKIKFNVIYNKQYYIQNYIYTYQNRIGF